MVTDGPALEGVTLGSAGLAAALARGKAHCDMSTIDLDTSRRLAAHYAARGAAASEHGLAERDYSAVFQWLEQSAARGAAQ